jgi:hypothetical protein
VFANFEVARGCLLDDGSRSAFDIWTQILNVNFAILIALLAAFRIPHTRTPQYQIVQVKVPA